ncbi:MAG: hypothetical protein CSA65_09265 [Proteobacteria bacterium]|nr:MAG: hypothetical protein CSA65_09265 [Pseudomonadota bacterium]
MLVQGRKRAPIVTSESFKTKDRRSFDDNESLSKRRASTRGCMTSTARAAQQPKNDTLQPTIDKTVEALQATLGERMVAIYTFGSSFGRTPQGPRMRLLLVVDGVDRALLDDIAPIATRAHRAGVALRLETQEALIRGTDAFPVFSLELLDTAQLVCGDDLLPQLKIEPGRLRLRLEQSLRTMHRDLVRAYLESGGAPQRLATELRRAAHRLIYLFQATLIACEVEVPADKTPALVIAALCRYVVTPADSETWEKLRSFAAYEAVFDRGPLVELYANVLQALTTVIEVVDRMEVA